MSLYIKTRSIVRYLALNILGEYAKPAKGVHILNGHVLKTNNTDNNSFLDLLNELYKISTFIRIEEAIKLINDRKVVDDTLLAFTFDDGFKECSDQIAPTLEEFGVNGLFFINPNFVDGDEAYIKNFTENIVFSPGKRPMRWNDILKIHASGHLIGAHTMDHYLINSCNMAEVQYQIADCKKVIENKLKSSCEYFAFPYGQLRHVNPSSIKLATEHYKYVFSQSNYKHYFSFDGKVINRRHFEPHWPLNHVKYFISFNKKY